MNTEIKQLLEGVQNGTVSVDDALKKLKTAPYEDIGYAKSICTVQSDRDIPKLYMVQAKHRNR